MLTYQRVYDKNKTAYLRGVASIVLLLRKDGKRRYVQTGIQIPPDQWNSEDQIVRRSPYSSVYNEQLDAFEQRVIDIAHELRLQYGDFYELDELVALANGIPLHILQKMLGHTSIKTTQIYAKVLAEDVERAFAGLRSVTT